MITIIHGADIASSRKYFLDQKPVDEDVSLIDGQNVTITDLVQIFEGGGLFSDSKNFFIEQLLGKRKKSKELEQIIDVITKNSDENNIYLWEEKELSKSTLSTFKNPIVKLFKLPQTLFLFLESIKPKNGKVLVSLFQQTIDVTDVEMVFFMMIRQVRILLALIDPALDGIDEVKRMAPWQKTKIQNQADNFEIDELKSLYNKLFEIEKGLKTGTLPIPLKQTIDLWLLDI